MKNLLLLVLVAASLTGCQENSKTSEGHKDGYTHDLKSKKDSLYQEVMDGHDVGMAKMGKLSGAIKNVKASIDSLKKSPTPAPARLAILESIEKDLAQAEYGMNRWMEEFVIDSAENNEPVRIKYLESERDMVNTIKERILSSLKRYDSLTIK